VKIYRRIVAVLCLLCFICVGIFSASALDNTQELTVKFGRDGLAVSGSTVRIYKIGSMSEKEKKIIPEGAFENLKVDYEYKDTQSLANLALTLEGIVFHNKIQENYRDVTDEKGEADFDGAQFPEGAYLVLASKVTQDGVCYIAAPSVIFLPYIENGLKYDVVTLELKYEIPEDKTVSRKVLKVWKNDREDMRSEAVSVKLLCNGSVYDTQKLSAENGWSYTWHELTADCRWTIVEENVSSDYEVSISFEGITFIMTNDAHLPSDEPSDEPTTDEDVPGRPTRPDHYRPHPDDDDDELPYTGTNIRFVPYLAIIGTLFFIFGYASYRKGELSDEQE